MARVLIVDDEKELRRTLSENLEREGYETDEAEGGAIAVEKAGRETFDVILLDLMMPEMDGLATLRELKKHAPRPKVIIMTAFATVQNAVDAMKLGASDYILKPFKMADLAGIIGRALEEARFAARAESLDLDYALGCMSNPIRRRVVRMLIANGRMRLMEITRELEIEDHTKVVFHLRTLREHGLLTQDGEKSYLLTEEGKKMWDCLNYIEDRLTP